MVSKYVYVPQLLRVRYYKFISNKLQKITSTMNKYRYLTCVIQIINYFLQNNTSMLYFKLFFNKFVFYYLCNTSHWAHIIFKSTYWTLYLSSQQQSFKHSLTTWNNLFRGKYLRVFRGYKTRFTANPPNIFQRPFQWLYC